MIKWNRIAVNNLKIFEHKGRFKLYAEKKIKPHYMCIIFMYSFHFVQQYR